jgi:hypothetical protein
MPKFSVILVHFQGTVPHETLCRGLNCIQSQTSKDFELLAYHDGPLLDTSVPMPVQFKCSEKRFDDWGHSLRDIGLREATGEYILHFNADNILYPNALEEIGKVIDRPSCCFRKLPNGELVAVDTNAMVIFPILMRGKQRFFDDWIYFPQNPECTVLLTGVPPRALNIDAMQLVMRRELWLAEGGWYDKRQAGDGDMYNKFAEKYGYRAMDKVLGEHF